MKKFIYSIAALAAIVVMGSCSQDSDLTSVKSSSSKVGNVTVSLNINSGISVTENNASMAKSSVKTANMLSTRAGSTNDQVNFIATLPGDYTAYFVAAEKTSEFAKGAIVQEATVKSGNNSISVPAIKCNIYVTNYDPYTPIKTDFTAKEFNEANVVALEDSLPKTSTTLYLYGSSLNNDFSSEASAEVELTNHYAAVCVKNNSNTNTPTENYVNSVAFNYQATDFINGSLPFREIKDYAKTDDTNWFYMYIKASGATEDDKNFSTTSNSTITLNKDAFRSLINPTWPLNNPITADNIYQYTVNPTNGGQGATLTVSVNAFQGTPIDGTLNPY